MKLKTLFLPLVHRVRNCCFYRPGFDWVEDLRRMQSGVENIFDVGANEGQALSRMRRIFKNSRFWCFEPDPDTFSRLQEKTEKQSSIQVWNLALGGKNETTHLNRMQGSDGNSILPHSNHIQTYGRGAWSKPTGKTVKISVQRLDTFCREQSVSRIDLLKIDTQGFEEAVLEGCGNLLSIAKIKAICLEVNFVSLYQNQSSWTRVFELLETRGYQLVDLYDKRRHCNVYLAWCDALFISP